MLRIKQIQLPAHEASSLPEETHLRSKKRNNSVIQIVKVTLEEVSLVKGENNGYSGAGADVRWVL